MLVGLDDLLEDVLRRLDVLRSAGHREDGFLRAERRLGHHDLGVGVVGDFFDDLAGHADGPLEHFSRELELDRGRVFALDEDLVVVDGLAPGAVIGDGVRKLALDLLEPALACSGK